MGRVLNALAAGAVAAMAAQPCLAADDMRDAGAGERRSSAFAGLSVKVPVGRSGGSRETTARLQISTVHETRDARSGSVRSFRPAGLELGLGAKGKAALYLNGQETKAIERKLGIGGSTTTLIVIGGIVVLVLIVAAAASAVPQPGPREGAFD